MVRREREILARECFNLIEQRRTVLRWQDLLLGSIEVQLCAGRLVADSPCSSSTECSIR